MIRAIMGRFWPRSLQGQLLLAVSLALLLAQSISAALLYRAQNDRREAALIHTAALRLFAEVREEGAADRRGPGGRGGRQLNVEQSSDSPIAPAELRDMFEAAASSSCVTGTLMGAAPEAASKRAPAKRSRTAANRSSDFWIRRSAAMSEVKSP